jgi:hypothetical protein
MSDHDPTSAAPSAGSPDPVPRGRGPSPRAAASREPSHGSLRAGSSSAESVRAGRAAWSRVDVIGAVIAALLGVGVAVLALDMKFEADQARWQQRQTCLAWYQLQAEYGLGPWFEKLPVAASDCGGVVRDDGVPLVPGGDAPAVESEGSVAPVD